MEAIRTCLTDKERLYSVYLKVTFMSFTYAMKAEEVHAKLYKEALDSLDDVEEVFYYLCPVCGNIKKSRPEKCSICGVPGDKFIQY